MNEGVQMGRASLSDLRQASGGLIPPDSAANLADGAAAPARVYSLPEGYRLRLFQPGDETHWARIETAAGEFAEERAALQHFGGEFGAYSRDMQERCLFLENAEGTPVGTTTAWYKSFAGESFGRLHWVGIVPEEQGRKLAKPLVAAALELLALRHRKAMLTTQTPSWKAIGMYLDFGFVPLLDAANHDAAAWRWLEEKLGRSIMPLAVGADDFLHGN
ncbi:GNAT family N-acetyltransferase [Paenibacillus sp. MBLB4367]|uniref:GNAT family N-acetyltransferase n=1 Tax=Paenibacillus sp. MBLB4367 TaxID=3384767 RepID=UPI003908429D